jgi:hypothetical protein
MANTVIQLKYSEVTLAPASLNIAEPAYSNTSGKLFIGRATGSPIAIGGKYYTDLVDAATDANTASAIVKRDASGIFSATAVRASLFGNANTASIWQTARTIGVSGDANGTVSIDGSANANIPLTLGNSGVTAGGYGSVTQIPTFTVDSKGRITSAANVSISTSLTVAGDSGSNVIALATDTLTFVGGDGITTSITPTDNVRFDVDNTVIRTSGGQTISGDLSVTGNLVISGNTITQDVENIRTEDSLISLAANNAADAIDIGFVGRYVSGTTKYTGLVKQAGGNYFLFQNLSNDPTTNTLSAGAATAANTATLRANLTGGTVSSLASAIAVADGGTGNTTFTGGGILIGNGTGALQTLANSTYTLTGGLAVANTISSLTVDAYGRVTAATGAAIAIGTGQITSGTLPIARGGTNQTTFTAGQRLVYDGTSLSSQANTSTTVTGGLAAANTITSLTYNSYGELTAFTGAAIAIDTSQLTSGTIADARLPTKGTAGTYGNNAFHPVITTDAYGRVTAVTNTAVQIDTSAITSGTLGVGRGGTGFASYTANGVIIGGLTSTSALTSVASSTEGHVLQISSSGIPTFAHLNGGSF